MYYSLSVIVKVAGSFNIVKYIQCHRSQSGLGGQYGSADYQTLLKRHNLRGSMSAKGICSFISVQLIRLSITSSSRLLIQQAIALPEQHRYWSEPLR